MAFKMKAGKKGPMYKNFPSAFKADIPEVTVTDKEKREVVVKSGYLEKDGKYYHRPKDRSINPYFRQNEASAKEALTVKRKSRLIKDDPHHRDDVVSKSAKIVEKGDTKSPKKILGGLVGLGLLKPKIKGKVKLKIK